MRRGIPDGTVPDGSVTHYRRRAAVRTTRTMSLGTLESVRNGPHRRNSCNARRLRARRSRRACRLELPPKRHVQHETRHNMAYNMMQHASLRDARRNRDVKNTMRPGHTPLGFGYSTWATVVRRRIRERLALAVCYSRGNQPSGRMGRTGRVRDLPSSIRRTTRDSVRSGGGGGCRQARRAKSGSALTGPKLGHVSAGLVRQAGER